MNSKSKFLSVVAAAGLALAGMADAAFAGTVTGQGAPIQVNGQAVAAGQTVQFKQNDVLKTGDGTAVIRSDGNDEISVDRNSSVKSDGTADGIEYLFVTRGIATGKLSTKTSLGTAVSWATAPEGQTTEVRVEAPSGREDVEGRFRTVKGGTWLRFNEYSTWLPEAHSINLWRERAQPKFLCFRTSQQNEGVVEIRRQVSGGAIRLRVPRATSGCVEDKGSKTKVTNDVTSNKQQKVEVATEFGSASSAQIGPGAYAIIDNATGGIELVSEEQDDSIGEEVPGYDPVDDASDVSAVRVRKR